MAPLQGAAPILNFPHKHITPTGLCNQKFSFLSAYYVLHLLAELRNIYLSAHL
jgi:hypothetical protein